MALWLKSDVRFPMQLSICECRQYFFRSFRPAAGRCLRRTEQIANEPLSKLPKGGYLQFRLAEMEIPQNSF